MLKTITCICCPKGCLVTLDTDCPEETAKGFREQPVNNLAEFFSQGIPTLLIAGGADEVVPFNTNAKIMIDFCEENGIDLTYIVKPECKHHPHSLENVEPIIKFLENV